MSRIDWSKAGKRLRRTPPTEHGRNPDWNQRLQRWKTAEEYAGEEIGPLEVVTLAACPLCSAPLHIICKDSAGRGMADGPHAERVFAAGAARIAAGWDAVSRLRRIARALRALLRDTTLDCHAGTDHAARLRAAGLIMGDHCSIAPDAVITDPDYVRMGSNVRMSSRVHLFGHDGSINMVNRMLGTAYDAVGKIEIGDNVFIGHGVTILPGTTIGSDTIIGAGAVVKGAVVGGFVYAGSALLQIRAMNEHLLKLDSQHLLMSDEWRDLIEQRGSEFDPALEPALRAARVAAFYPDRTR